MQIYGIPNFKCFLSKVKLLHNTFPVYFPKTRGLWLESLFTIGFNSLSYKRGIFKSILPFKTILDCFSSTRSYGLTDNIICYHVDISSTMMIYHEDNSVCLILLLSHGELYKETDNELIFKVKSSEFAYSRTFGVSKIDFSIKELENIN